MELDLEHPEITHTLKTGYPTNEELARDNEPIKNNCCDEYITNEGDVEMENVKDFTVNDILDDNGQVDIHFHDCGDLQVAYNKLKPYMHLGKVNRHVYHDGTVWLKISSRYIKVIAFL